MNYRGDGCKGTTNQSRGLYFFNVDRDAEYIQLAWKNIVFLGLDDVVGELLGSHSMVKDYIAFPLSAGIPGNRGHKFIRLSYSPHPAFLYGKSRVQPHPVEDRHLRMNALISPTPTCSDYFLRLQNVLEGMPNYSDWPKKSIP